MLYILNVKQYDVTNGPGIRCSIWLAGCNNHCKGCWSPHTSDPIQGFRFVDKASKIEKYINNPKIDGISILGGDPLYWVFNNTSSFATDSIVNLLRLLRMCKNSKKPVWLWTGYTFERIKEEAKDILSYIDVLIDGKFDLTKRNLNLHWRGSSNQRVIDVQKSLKSNNLIQLKVD